MLDVYGMEVAVGGSELFDYVVLSAVQGPPPAHDRLASTVAVPEPILGM